VKTTKFLIILVVSLDLMVCFTGVSKAAPMGTAWTYQGRLMDGNSPADGEYYFQFKLFDDVNVVDGNQVGSDVNIPDVDVIDGYFTVELDFGAGVFDGDARWLEISVRDGDTLITLNPRHELTPTPYALQTRGIFVDPNGNVGIGTRSPVGKLHVGTTLPYGEVIFFDAGSGLNDLMIDHGSAYTDNIDRIYFVEVTVEGSFEKPDKFKWSDDNGVTWSADINMIRGWHDLSHGVRIKWFNTLGHSDGGTLPGDTWAWAAFCSRDNSLVVTDGKVGIGTATPAWELDVANLTAGDGAEVGVTANDAGGAFAAYSSTLGAPFGHYAGRVSLFAGLETPGLDLRADGNTGDIRFYTGGPWPFNERMRISSIGGIHMTSYSGDGLGSWIEGLYFVNNSSGMGPWSHAGIWTDGVSGFNGELVFGVDGDDRNNLTGIREAMRINRFGNVGIGTSSPNGKLHIRDTATAVVNIGGNGTADKAQLGLFEDSDTGQETGIRLEYDGSYDELNFVEYSVGLKGNELLTIQRNGNVGIGTTSPDKTLEISGILRVARETDNAHGADFSFVVDEPVTGHDGLIIDSDTGGGWSDIHLRTTGTTKLFVESGGNVGIGTTSPPEKLTVRGNLLIQSESTGASVLELGEGLDYAEGFDVSDRANIEAGTVLIIDSDNPGKLTVSRSAYDSKVAGIVAGANEIGSGVRLGVGQFDYDVALAGRVYCNVDATEETVQAGDQLTTSVTPGYAMKAKDYDRARGAVLGKAMESLEKGQKGQILVLVTLQ
jgi:hypothetical protein